MSGNPNQASGNADAAPQVTPTQTTPATPLGKAPAVTYYKQTPPPAGSPLEKVEPLELTVKNEPVGTTLNKGTVGISLEATPRRSHPELRQCLDGDAPQGLRRHRASFRRQRRRPPVLWTSSGESLPADYKGDKAHPAKVVTPQDLERVATLLDLTNAKISLTVDLGHDDPPGPRT